MVMLTEKEREKLFTPSPQEQTMLLLQNKCPHNKGWKYDGHGHNDDAYACNLCGKVEWW